jgi:DNA-binding response OmpR family regulator
VRVLVVEDVRRLADDIAEGLRDQGMAVDVAYTGLDAAAKLDINRYEVVVLDRDLPGIHGDTICRMITGSDNPAMVLMLTAADTPADRVSGLGLGADDYLPKPFHFPELVLRIRALARRKPTAAPRILKAADLELDPLHRTASRAGHPLQLTTKEFAVLEALMRASPATLSTENLLEQAWDEHRPLHQNSSGHHRPPAPQTRRARRDRNHSRGGLPHQVTGAGSGYVCRGRERAAISV